MGREWQLLQLVLLPLEDLQLKVPQIWIRQEPIISSTGKSNRETQRYQNVLEDIYKNNYGESFEDIGDAMSQVIKQMGDMDDQSLQAVTESAYALRDTFEYEIPESTRAAKAMMDNFGVSGEEAMSLIAARCSEWSGLFRRTSG